MPSYYWLFECAYFLEIESEELQRSARLNKFRMNNMCIFFQFIFQLKLKSSCRLCTRLCRVSVLMTKEFNMTYINSPLLMMRQRWTHLPSPCPSIPREKALCFSCRKWTPAGWEVTSSLLSLTPRLHPCRWRAIPSASHHPTQTSAMTSPLCPSTVPPCWVTAHRPCPSAHQWGSR